VKVFIAETDLFQETGGGQAVYRRLIAAHPEIEFYYLGVEERAATPRPANTHLVPRIDPYPIRFALDSPDGDRPPWARLGFVEASNVAASVAGREFDVVESADFRSFGAILRAALAWHGVRCGRTVLAMHGRTSDSLRRDWSGGGACPALDHQERLQYRAADTRYGISPAYLDQWRQMEGLEAQYVSPLRVVERPRPGRPPPSAEPPDVHFIGRTERLKGPDIFLELLWWLPRRAYGAASLIGPESLSPNGGCSGSHLKRLLAHRAVDVTLRPAMTPAELGRLFAARSVVFLPSRYDTLNLVALESLLAGCPTVVGSGAGVCRFLSESLPEIPYVRLDLENLYGCLPEIRRLLADYDGYRERLVAALQRCQPEADGLSLAEVYASPPCGDPAVRSRMDSWYAQAMRRYEASGRTLRGRIRGALRGAAKAVLPARWEGKLRRLGRSAAAHLRTRPAAVKQAILESPLRGDAVVAYHLRKSLDMPRRCREVLALGEESAEEVSEKLGQLWAMAGEFRVDSARLWSGIARLERVRGNEPLAAAYELRILRALGEDRLGHLPATAAGLRRSGLVREAETAEAMFGPAEGRAEACEALLRRALDAHRENPPRPWERIDDRRPPGPCRVAVIVSLYKAAGKLSFFLHALANQTLLESGAVEVILVDSGSPDGEHAVFSRCQESLRLPAVYARSAGRETIQAAWNRGISLARAPYLAFLGVDETLLPDALEVLAGELDRDGSLDWATGSSLMTRVDEHGTWKDDVMLYDRSDYHPALPYLDTAYLSWVGGLYRRSVHERFGYYDGTFVAAGDTEFKYRVLPKLKTRSVPRTLGIFLNYPENRVTESPQAEIEDLRAWYLHRTQGGIRYAFDGRDPHEALDLFYRALGYRKSFWRHTSTDLELAAELAAYLECRAPGLLPASHAAAVRRVLDAYRSLDWLPQMSRWGPARALLHARRVAARAQAAQRRLGNPPAKPLYRVFNDNRFEQHRNVWQSPPGALQ
jgi:glycosyltransferase involved in cell wall biosynthesis